MDKKVVLIGGGASISEGIKLDLWNKLYKSGIDCWSINFAYMAMPFLPTKELWLDTTFFRNNMDSLYTLESKGVQLITKKNAKYDNIPSIIQYGITREKLIFPFNNNNIYIGSNGLSGFFALSVAIYHGYSTIYLLGYDFGTNSLNNTNTHFYQNDIVVRSSGVRNPGVYLQNNNNVKKEVNCFNHYKQIPVNIINVSPASHISAFPKLDYPAFLQQIS